jgi:peroxiredoxin
MTETMVGRPAPSFRLPSAQGPEVALEDYRGSNVILLFAKGMACGFCRQKMSQLARGLPRFRELHTEVLQIAPTPHDRGRFYARNFRLPFPYLCDPDYRAYAAYGLGRRKFPLGTWVRAVHAGLTMPTPENDWGEIRPAVNELGRLFADDDLGLFIVDRDGVIRHAVTGSYVIIEEGRLAGMRPIPANDEIARVLEGCQARTA